MVLHKCFENVERIKLMTTLIVTWRIAETEIVIFVAFTIIKVKVRPRRSIFPKEIQSLIATDDSRVAAQFLKAI